MFFIIVKYAIFIKFVMSHEFYDGDIIRIRFWYDSLYLFNCTHIIKNLIMSLYLYNSGIKTHQHEYGYSR